MFVCRKYVHRKNTSASCLLFSRTRISRARISRARTTERFIYCLFGLPLIGLLLIVGGCNRDDASARERTQRDRGVSLLADVVMFNVDMYDSYYGTTDTNLTAPPVWTVQSGADVVVNILNHGLLDHNWAVIKKGVTIPVPYEEGQAGDIVLHGVGMVYNNSQTTITFIAPESGEYQVICTVAGHYPFMQGKLRVVDAE